MRLPSFATASDGNLVTRHYSRIRAKNLDNNDITDQVVVTIGSHSYPRQVDPSLQAALKKTDLGGAFTGKPTSKDVPKVDNLLKDSLYKSQASSTMDELKVY